MLRVGGTTVKPVPQRVRALLGERTVIDTASAQLLWEEGARVAIYAVPEADVAPGTAGVRALPGVAGYVAADWEAFDRWLEEDEDVVGHPRDPYHRVDVRASTRAVRVEVDGTVVAGSERPMLLFETDLPVRCYLPRQDVRMDRLAASATTTVCPYKGCARYWSVAGNADLAWAYDTPLEECARIAGLICFLQERCDVWLGGEPLGRPETAWSDGVRANPRGGPSAPP